MDSVNTVVTAESPASSTTQTQTKGWADVTIAYSSTASQILWIIFWFTFILVFYHKIARVLEAIIKRVNDGSEITAITALGQIIISGSKAPSVLNDPNINATTVEGIAGKEIKNLGLEEKVLNYQDHAANISESLYLVHGAEVLKEPDPNKPGTGNYAVRVWLEGYDSKELQDCIRVTYRLDTESFENKVISTEVSNQQFELWLTIWGEFTIIAYLERKHGKEPIWLTRYLDLPGRPQDATRH